MGAFLKSALDFLMLSEKKAGLTDFTLLPVALTESDEIVGIDFELRRNEGWTKRPPDCGLAASDSLVAPPATEMFSCVACATGLAFERHGAPLYQLLRFSAVDDGVDGEMEETDGCFPCDIA